MTGWKFTRRMSDGQLFMITAECKTHFHSDGYDGRAFYSTDCIIQRIEDTEGNTADTVDGEAYRPYVYTVGQEIKGEKIFFFDDLDYCRKFIARIQFGDAWKPTEKMLAAYNDAQLKSLYDPGIRLRMALGMKDEKEIKEAFQDAELLYFMEAGFSYETYQRIQNWLTIGQKLILRSG